MAGVISRDLHCFRAESADATWSWLSKVLAGVLKFAVGDAEKSAPARRSALLIGGEARQQRFCELILRELGFAPEAIDTCAAGVQMLSARTYQLVIVDERTGDFSTPFWERLIETAELRADGCPTQFFFIGEPRSPSAGPHPAATCLPRPLRALDLVRAAEQAG